PIRGEGLLRSQRSIGSPITRCIELLSNFLLAATQHAGRRSLDKYHVNGMNMDVTKSIILARSRTFYLPRLVQHDQAPAQRRGRLFGAVVCFKFGQDTVDVILNCAFGNRQAGGNLLVTETSDDQPEHFQFAAAEFGMSDTRGEPSRHRRGYAMLTG